MSQKEELNKVSGHVFIKSILDWTYTPGKINKRNILLLCTKEYLENILEDVGVINSDWVIDVDSYGITERSEDIETHFICGLEVRYKTTPEMIVPTLYLSNKYSLDDGIFSPTMNVIYSKELQCKVIINNFEDEDEGIKH